MATFNLLVIISSIVAAILAPNGRIGARPLARANKRKINVTRRGAVT